MDSILHPLIVAFAWIWVRLHDLVVLIGIPATSGAGWALSIVLLTILVRVLILPLYLKQIKSQRSMQVLQPELKKLQAKYKGKTDQLSRQRQSEEMSELYKKNGTSPFASCLPLLVQMPILFGLYRVISAVQRLAAGEYGWDALGPLNKTVAQEIVDARVLGVNFFDNFGSAPGAHKIVFVVLIVLMVFFQYTSMRMSMKRNMPPQDPENPMARSQGMMLVLMPAVFAFTGFVFQMALLIYMLTTAVFSWAQQLWVLKVMPTPGSPAYQDLVTKRQNRYQQWAEPRFTEYDDAVQALNGENGSDPEAVAELQEKTLVDVKAKAKTFRVDTDFPESWDTTTQLSVLRGLASGEWKALPDEVWLRDMESTQRNAEDARARRSRQPRKMSREERMREAQLSSKQEEQAAKAAERAKRRAEQKQSKPAGNLTDEEIERRRAQRRAAQRKNKRGKSNN